MSPVLVNGLDLVVAGLAAGSAVVKAVTAETEGFLHLAKGAVLFALAVFLHVLAQLAQEAAFEHSHTARIALLTRTGQVPRVTRSRPVRNAWNSVPGVR
jgi:hypothetical protein